MFSRFLLFYYFFFHHYRQSFNFFSFYWLLFVFMYSICKAKLLSWLWKRQFSLPFTSFFYISLCIYLSIYLIFSLYLSIFIFVLICVDTAPAIVSDAVRSELLRRSGGVFLDLDIITLRPLPSRANWLGRLDHNQINTAVANFTKNHRLLQVWE